MSLFKSALCAVLFVLGVESAYATLIDRGGGMIYDADRNITWLSNANLGAGSIFDNGNSVTDGKMTWANAVAWAQSLTVGGVTDWRLPTTLQPDGSCGTLPNVYPGGTGSNCTGSELGHLFYTEFGGTAESSILSGSNTANLALFSNIQDDVYWSGTLWNPTVAGADSGPFVFETHNGRQVVQAEELSYYAWAVHDGDVGAPPLAVPLPEPATLALFALGLAGLGFSRRRKA
jgi:hypothetical protein